MLPEKLLDVSVDGTEIIPHYLGARDRPWIQALLDRWLACSGKARSEVSAALLERPHIGERPVAWRAMAALLLRTGGFCARSKIPSPIARMATFEAAAAHLPLSPATRRAALNLAATQLNCAPADLESALYADLPGARILSTSPGEPSETDWIDRYNLALAQGLLARSISLRVRLREKSLSLIRFARLKGLLCIVRADATELEAPSPPPTCLELSGPLSLFRQTLKYSRAMAQWFPLLTKTPGYELTATCLYRSSRLQWRVSSADPVGATGQPIQRFDSAVERRLFRDIQRTSSSWSICRESDPVLIAQHWHCADFSLAHRRTGTIVGVEIIGFWTPEYLERKLSTLAAILPRQPWLLCVNQDLGPTALSDILKCLLAHGWSEKWMLPYKKSVDAAKLLARLDGILAAAPFHGVRHKDAPMKAFA